MSKDIEAEIQKVYAMTEASIRESEDSLGNALANYCKAFRLIRADIKPSLEAKLTKTEAHIQDALTRYRDAYRATRKTIHRVKEVSDGQG